MNENTNKASSGVNREEAKSILNRFLYNKDYKVLAVKGKWGVGKTHLVQKFLDEHKKEYYSYASVFGISSIEHLKSRLIASYKGKENKKLFDKSISSFVEFSNRNSGKLEKTPKIDLPFSEQLSIPIAGSLISVAGDLALNILFNVNVKNSLVCIDDLERKSKLPLDELLGFVEYLVQELECQIILIYNEDILLKHPNSKDADALQQYREKVIDIEFKLDPTVEENLNFIFKHHPDIEVIKEVFIRAAANNIRVIRKTKWLIDELIPLMENWEPSLRNQIIKNTIIINLAKLDTDFPERFSINDLNPNPIDTILSCSSSAQELYDKRKDNETANKRFAFCQKIAYIGYRHLEQINELIIQYLKTSLLKCDELLEKGEILNQREKKKQIIEKLDKFSNDLYKSKYHSSFADNEEDIIDGINTFLEQNHLDLSISEFESLEKFTSILEVDISIYEKPLLEKIITEIFESNPYNNLSAFRDKLSKYPDLKASLDNKINEYRQTFDITTVVKNLMNADSRLISPGLELDTELLNEYTLDEYCQWLEKGHPDLCDMVRWFLDSGYNPASKKLEKAIRMLAECSILNKVRAKYLYKIDIDK